MTSLGGTGLVVIGDERGVKEGMKEGGKGAGESGGCAGGVDNKSIRQWIPTDSPVTRYSVSNAAGIAV